MIELLERIRKPKKKKAKEPEKEESITFIARFNDKVVFRYELPGSRQDEQIGVLLHMLDYVNANHYLKISPAICKGFSHEIPKLVPGDLVDCIFTCGHDCMPAPGQCWHPIDGWVDKNTYWFRRT